jgi:hypothetical protein
VLDPAYTKLANSGNGTLYPTIVVDGQVLGTWKRTLKKDSLAISTGPFAKLKRAETNAINEAATRYGKFPGLSLRRFSISSGSFVPLSTDARNTCSQECDDCELLVSANECSDHWSPAGC